MSEYEVITVEYAGASFSITPFGGHLLTYIPPTQTESILWCSSTHKKDMSKSIRGGVPVCFPQFGLIHDKVSPQHGWARLQVWTVVSSTDRSVSMTLTSSENQKQGRPDWGMWPANDGCPYKARLTLKVSLSDAGELSYAVAVRNEGEVTMPYQLLLHNYFSAESQDPEFGVTGLGGYEVIDTQPRGREGLGMDYFTQGSSPIRVDGEVDRIFHGKGPVTAEIKRGSNLGVARVSVSASPPRDVSCVVWNPHEAKAGGMGDFDDQGWRGMICVEPGLIDGLQMIKGGEEQVLKQVITYSS
ncbi:hypothetical protein TrRE_jg2880 [Triparma retinervis]|uniref:glucose-6-phosphate 1-epimerase n=1 Tax=Triparma retinervis TaxID=2557542 RepID=A0A9W6ZA59_9STRA|nr:hypothetical protein TrRE_jg2880 [Triparma retinervis]